MWQRILILLLLICSISTLSVAQQAVVATGGDVTGSGGMMSSSSGQTDFIYLSNESWSIQFGMQQTQKAQMVNVDPDPPEGGTIIGGGNHPIGSEVSLMAQAKPGWEFVMWIGNFLELPPNKHSSQSTSNPITILIQQDTYIMTIFQQVPPVAVPLTNWAIYLGAILILIFGLVSFRRKVI